MAHLLAPNPTTSLKLFFSESSINGVRNASCYNGRRKRHRFGQCCGGTASNSRCSTSSVVSAELQIEKRNEEAEEGGRRRRISVVDDEIKCLVCENGWRVRRLVEKDEEIRNAANVQAEAFHVPVSFFNPLFFQFFQAEVLSGLLYKLKNSPRDRYACLVAEAATICSDSSKQIVGVVDVTASRDGNVLQLLPPEAQEYLYISGIAVSSNFRRRKVATALLKACDVLSVLWGFEFLVLRAYEEDWGARKLYSKAGYEVVYRDPPWLSTWIGRKCRVLMIKALSKQKLICIDSAE
ncbi:uncharacterized protein LOC129313508 [Prosopis cineraria]|uniref:uncharacterized protein LOC129313508 n=1 Tax=Prosopis cineraria TaxID=364024 RepID=UPI00240FB126|nr:uncharacterized protein LOC129313508 [Prosopis cineraria]